MFDDLFASASSDRFSASDHLGEVVLVEGLEILDAVKTDYGMKEAAEARITVVTGDNAGTVYDDARLFSGALVGDVKRAMRGQGGNKPILAKVTQKPAKNPAHKPAWVFDKEAVTDAQKAEAVRLYTEAKAARDKAEAPF